MNIKKLCVLLALASTFALGSAIAQESDDSSATKGAATERQRPDREGQRRENMTDEQRAAARDRWQGMSDEQRQTARDKRRSRESGGKGGKRGKGGGNGQRRGERGGERTPKSGTDAA